MALQFSVLADLMSFINALAADTQGAHTGICLEIRKDQTDGLSQTEEDDLAKVLRKALGGSLRYYGPYE